jgi:rRNA processing protein Krr1/Pno1
LKEIESCCAAKIKIPRGEDWNGSIVLSGDFEGVAMARDKILSIVQERANKTSIQIEIERTLAPFLWNTELSGLNQEELAESFPAVKLNLIKSGEGAHLNLIGDKGQIETIRQLVERSLINLRSSIKSVSTFVPKALHRLLIGPKGSVLHQLEEETGCGIFVPSVKEEPENQQVTIYGPEDKLLKGLSSLMEKVKGMSSEKIKIPEISFKLLQNVQKYRNELKSFDSEVSFHFANFSIEIDGKKENVMNFIAKVQEILTELSVYKVQDTLEVDQEYLKHVIGRKGQNLQQIQRDFQVEILIESEGIVSFIGKDLDSVQKAKEHVNYILSSVVDLLTMTARIDSKYHGLLIGSKGSNLSSYHEKYPAVMINFLSESNEVTFKGPKSEVEPCYNEMTLQAEKIRHEMIMNSYTQVIELKDEKLLKSSRDVAFLTNFTRQHDCKLITTSANSITLQGNKKAVDLTLPLLKEQINLIQDRDSLSFSVDPQYHGILIGSEGRNLKHLITKYSVKVDFPKNISAANEDEADNEHIDSVSSTALSGSDQNTIKIIGPKANIKKARDELLDLLKYHLDHDNQEIIQVPSKSVPSLIGKNGSVVDSIKIESDCKIDFLNDTADEGSESKNVKLSGTIESISRAKKLIFDLVKELKEHSEEKFEVSSGEVLKSLTSGSFKREYRKITSKYPNLNFYARDSYIKIKGKTDHVFESKKELETLVKSIESNEIQKLELDVPTRVYGKILGVSGANIKELTTEFDCDIVIPRQGQEGPVHLIGQSEKVKALADKIRSYCLEERLFKFPSPAIKSSIMSELGKDESFFSGIEIKAHPHGILLIGEMDKIDQVKIRLQEEISKRKE